MPRGAPAALSAASRAFSRPWNRVAPNSPSRSSPTCCRLFGFVSLCVAPATVAPSRSPSPVVGRRSAYPRGGTPLRRAGSVWPRFPAPRLAARQTVHRSVVLNHHAEAHVLAEPVVDAMVWSRAAACAVRPGPRRRVPRAQPSAFPGRQGRAASHRYRRAGRRDGQSAACGVVRVVEGEPL